MGNISVAKMFIAGILPGAATCFLLCLNVWFRAHFTQEGKQWPSTKISARQTLRCTLRAIPALGTFIIIMGSIMKGICTPTEAAVLAVWYSIFLGVIYRKVTLKGLWETLKATAATCGPLFIIMTSASIFTWILTREGLATMISNLMAQYVGVVDQKVIVAISVLVFLLIGCFIDSSSAVLLLSPVVMPIMRAFGVDMVYFGVLMVYALIIGVITPPFGICLFVVSGVAKLPVSAVTKEAVRYLPMMFVLCIIMILFPQLVTFLPNLLFG